MEHVTQEQWVETLRSYIGTRFRHQGRMKGPKGGVDCVGLLICALQELGMARGSELIKGYSRQPTDDDFNKHMGNYTVKLPYNRLQALTGQMQLGDAMTFWIEKEGLTRHVAIYTGYDNSGRPMMIHSYAMEGRGVIETPINPNFWTRRVTALFRFHEFCGE